MIVGTLDEMQKVLEQAQRERLDSVVLWIDRPLAAQINRERLRDQLTLLLPQVQQRRETIRQERDGRWYLNASLRYRDGIRLLAGERLTFQEQEALEKAKTFARSIREARPQDRECVRALTETVHTMAPYGNPPQGTVQRRQAVSALAVLSGREANCQGFSDCFYLLAGLCGIRAEYQTGFKGREMHLWNRVLVEDSWLRVDATSGQIDDISGGEKT